jgi:hypothetical protein
MAWRKGVEQRTLVTIFILLIVAVFMQQSGGDVYNRLSSIGEGGEGTTGNIGDNTDVPVGGGGPSTSACAQEGGECVSQPCSENNRRPIDASCILDSGGDHCCGEDMDAGSGENVASENVCDNRETGGDPACEDKDWCAPTRGGCSFDTYNIEEACNAIGTNSDLCARYSTWCEWDVTTSSCGRASSDGGEDGDGGEEPPEYDEITCRATLNNGGGKQATVTGDSSSLHSGGGRWYVQSIPLGPHDSCTATVYKEDDQNGNSMTFAGDADFSGQQPDGWVSSLQIRGSDECAVVAYEEEGMSGSAWAFDDDKEDLTETVSYLRPSSCTEDGDTLTDCGTPASGSISAIKSLQVYGAGSRCLVDLYTDSGLSGRSVTVAGDASSLYWDSNYQDVDSIEVMEGCWAELSGSGNTFKTTGASDLNFGDSTESVDISTEGCVAVLYQDSDFKDDSDGCPADDCGRCTVLGYNPSGSYTPKSCNEFGGRDQANQLDAASHDLTSSPFCGPFATTCWGNEASSVQVINTAE